jgi:cytochrome c553
MKSILSLLVLTVLFSCQKKAEEKTCPIEQKKQSKFKMYQMSEMSLLMEQMFADNMRLKTRIMSGEAVGKFPEHFDKIHQAEMTDPSENDDFFQEQADIYLASQHLIYDDSAQAKKHFNTGVDACIKCHEAKCTGPIERIKKLYIP